MKKISLLTVFFILGCSNDPIIPKPNAFLYKEFQTPNYKLYQNNCGFSFQINDKSIITQEGCNLKIKNLKLRSTIFITHIKIDNNLSLIESDFTDKINKNSENAFFVNSSEYVDEQKKVFAKYFSFSGDTPSNTYFFITDSDKFYLSGSLFFDSKPNYDSLLPSINHVNKNIRKLIQSFNWN